MRPNFRLIKTKSSKVNLHKSKVSGVGVNDLEVNRLASILNCEPSYFPFSYFGLPSGPI